jgi:hypothetical protein
MRLYEKIEKRSNLCRQSYEELLRRRKKRFETAIFSIINAGVMVAGGLYVYWVGMPQLSVLIMISSVWMYLSALDDRRDMNWIDLIIMTRMDNEIKKED